MNKAELTEKRVADNGSPVLSATQSFQVFVNSLSTPGVGNFSLSYGLLRITFSGDRGPDYYIQASTNLTNWQSVFTNLNAVPPVVWTNSDTTNFSSRFYRVLLGP